AGGASGDATESTPTAEPTPEPTPEGSVALAGLRLRIAGVDDNFDAREFDAGSAVATRIELDLTNETDSRFSVSAFEFALLDSGGTGHEISPCTGCPGSLEEPISLEPGETERASLYYNLPPGSEPADLRYRSSDSGEDVTLPVVAS